MASLQSLREKLFRLKTIGEDYLESRLHRCLTTADITLLGIGHMIGAGVYVLTGAVIRDTAGPGIVLSFFFAGIASFLSALCYAEFGARVPKAGSAYAYSYLTVGEFWAFTIGWNIILEHMVGAAAVARSFSGYLDTLLSHGIQNATKAAVGTKILQTHSTYFSAYPDFVAFVIVLLVAVLTGVGAKTSTRMNNVFVCINMCVIAFVVLYGGTFANFDYWVPFNTPRQGFMPYGFGGVVSGAASCFFAYIGFDGLSSAAEEATNPGKSIPIATFVSMAIVTTSYILMSAALTLMVPYNQIHPTSAFADAFGKVGRPWAKYAVGIGALSGMTTSLAGSMFALPRCVYAMAQDGLLFRGLVPLLAVMIFGTLAAVIALVFDVETLVEFLSIGTLLAYTIVSAAVVILRYRPVKEQTLAEKLNLSASTPIDTGDAGDKSMLVTDTDDMTGAPKPFLAPIQSFTTRFEPGALPTYLVAFMTGVFFALGFWLRLIKNIVLKWLGGILFAAIAVVALIILNGHHMTKREMRFKTPFVPFLPLASVFINVILMVNLSMFTWMRLVVWLGIGYLIYFFYGLKHSQENHDPNVRPIPGESYTNPNYGTHSTITTSLPSAEPNMTVEATQPK